VKRKVLGFTLVELLLVIIIVAILASIAIPKITKQAIRSKESNLRLTLRQMREAQQRFYNLYGGFNNDLEDLIDTGPPKYICVNGIKTDFAPRKYEGRLLGADWVKNEDFNLDPISGQKFKVNRLESGELQIYSSASGVDSNGLLYSSY
jgi:prepilin-type N-terminal cleavage/methylation domain-containing protein